MYAGRCALIAYADDFDESCNLVLTVLDAFASSETPSNHLWSRPDFITTPYRGPARRTVAFLIGTVASCRPSPA